MAKRSITNLFGLLPSKEKDKKQTDLSLSSGWGSALSFLSSTGQEVDALVRLMDACNTSQSVTPKDWALLTRTALDRVPLIKRAIRIHQDMMGEVTIPEWVQISDRTREIAEAYIENLPLLSELTPNEPQGYGLSTLAKRILKDCMVEGIGIAEDRFVAYDGEVSEDYKGVMLFNPRNWAYEFQPKTKEFTLTYLDGQKPNYKDGQYVHNPYFHRFVTEQDHGTPWGIPIMRGSLIIFKVFVSLLLCIELQGKRFGNPPTLTLITGTDPAKFQDEKVKKIFLTVIEKLKNDLAGAWELIYSGRPADVVAAVPGDADVLSRTLGAEIDTWVEPDMLWKIGILACNTLEVPPPLLSLNDVGGGMNSDMFKQHYRLLKARAESNRKALKPSIMSMLCNFLLNERVAPAEVERLDIEFSGISFDDEKAAADTDKVRAETRGIVLDNYDRMKINPELDPEGYAEDEGLV